MFQYLYQYPATKQHLYSLLISIVCLGLPLSLALLSYPLEPEYRTYLSPVFVLSTAVIARYTISRWYSIGCCIFTAVCFYLASPLFHANVFSFNRLITLLSMTAIALFVSGLSERLAEQETTIAERERELFEREQETMRANLLRAISHDLRTPLTGIIGNSSLILENGETLTETEKEKLISNIHEDSNWLLNMVENLLTITRIRGDNLSINKAEESVEEVISEALQKLAKRYPDTQINASIPDDFILLPMDAILIEQVTINLLSNAILYSKSTRPIDLIVRDTPHSVVFTVRDYGVGLSPNELETLVEGNLFPTHSSDSHKGMGIGLSICKTIISAHHGTLTARNRDTGADFTFTLPKH